MQRWSWTLDGAGCQDNLQIDAADATQMEMKMIRLQMIAGHNELSRFWGVFAVLSVWRPGMESAERRYAVRRSGDQATVEQLCRIWVISPSNR